MGSFKVKNVLNELIGTFILVLLGAGSAVFSLLLGVGLVVPLVFGLVVIALVAVGGGQYNPAVSLAFAIRERISFLECIFNVLAQIIGAIFAGLMIWLISGDQSNLGSNGFNTLISAHGDTNGALIAILVEMIITFIFVLIILRVTTKPEQKSIAPFVIGLSLFAFISFAFTITGGSLNPARSFGPALIEGGDALKNVWVYFVGPLLGGLFAGLVDLFAKE